MARSPFARTSVPASARADVKDRYARVYRLATSLRPSHVSEKLGAFLMEMHQVRYFLAGARILNFTRAAEECHVAQPSLTRAIKQLEAEFGGDLFRRERPHVQITDLGQKM